MKPLVFVQVLQSSDGLQNVGKISKQLSGLAQEILQMLIVSAFYSYVRVHVLMV